MFSVTSFEDNQSQQNLEDRRPQVSTTEDSIQNTTNDVNRCSCLSHDLVRSAVDHASFASCSSININIEDAEQYTTAWQNSTTIDIYAESASTPYSMMKTTNPREMILTHNACCSSSTKYNHGHCGLMNLGNTCFMNSILQCLNNIPLLVQYYLDHNYKKSSLSNSKHPVSTAFANLIESMRTSFTVRPTALKSAVSRYAPLFRSYGQQDAHEYLTALLDALHQESSAQTEEDGEERSIITDLFQGQMKYMIKCSAASQCKNITITTDPFLDIPVFIEKTMSSLSSTEKIVVIPDNNASLHIRSHTMTILCLPWILLKGCGKLLKNVFDNFCWLFYFIMMRIWYLCKPGCKRGIVGNFYQRIPISTPEKNPQTRTSELLEQCLINNISVVECMPPNSAWFCTHCRRNRQLTKENHILSLPQVLIIHLKRFNVDSPSRRRKIETFIKYPLELNMNEFLSSATADKEHIYDLIGVCLHSGSFERGHYTAYIKKTSGWFCFNDSFVSPISVKDVIDRNAYILFYLRRDY